MITVQKSKDQKVTQIKLSEIVEDTFYQTRKTMGGGNTSNTRIMEYTNCMKMGHEFPPLVLDASTNKIICGFTRYNAYKRAFKDPDLMVDVKIIDFKDDKERLGYAADDNAHHGQPLTGFERKALTKRLYEVGWKVPDVCMILGMKDKDVKSLVRFVKIDGPIVTRLATKNVNNDVKSNSSRAKKVKAKQNEPKLKVVEPVVDAVETPFVLVNGEEKVLIKSGLNHLSGKEISKEAYSFIMNHYLAWNDAALADHLVDRIDYKLVNTESENVIQSLKVLKCKLDELLS